MEKESRYYTPTIEEFHVGFEFEVDYGKEWVKESLWAAPQVVTLPYMRLENIRVKYLDREDIESLGFIHVGSLWFENKDLDCRIRKWKDTQIDIYTDWSRGEIECNNDLRFRGSCKNKSELKTLLNQLNVNK